MVSAGWIVASLALFVHYVHAQAAGWAPGQVNATMCQWQQARGMVSPWDLKVPEDDESSNLAWKLSLTLLVGVIRDTVYMDGGYLYWQPGMADSTYGVATLDGKQLSNRVPTTMLNTLRKSTRPYLHP